MGMIVHFVIDGKITDQIIENFLEVSIDNHFLVFGKGVDGTFNRIKRTGIFLSNYDDHKDDINTILTSKNAKGIVLHSLSYNFAKVVLKIEKKIPICWGVWGYDVYNLPKIEPNLYAPLTNQFLLKNNPGLCIERLIRKNNFLRKFYYNKIKQKDDVTGEVLDAIKKIDFFATYLDEDFEIFRNNYPNKLRFIRSSFSTIDQYLADNKKARIFSDAGNVLLGNSNSANSNYLDAISILSKHVDQLKKVYVVLSYGSDELHKREILLTGKRLLEGHFHPLLDFVERKDYIALLQSCAVGIFHHYRQRAMGNIIAMLYMGSRVYLSKKNPAYNFFLRNGIKVNSIENDFDKIGVTRLGEDLIENNRNCLDRIFNKGKVITDLRNLTEILTAG